MFDAPRHWPRLQLLSYSCSSLRIYRKRGCSSIAIRSGCCSSRWWWRSSALPTAKQESLGTRWGVAGLARERRGRWAPPWQVRVVNTVLTDSQTRLSPVALRDPAAVVHGPHRRAQTARVVLCVCTFRRPRGLTRLLDSLSVLDYAGELSVVIVDNDPDRQASAVYHRKTTAFRWPLSYHVEDRQGPSFARNRAVQVALRQHPDFIAMLDDDEYPGPSWLRALLAVQQTTGADVVGGPVLPRFSETPPQWIVKGRFFEKGTQLANESRVLLSSSANFLARSTCFISLLPAPFPEEYVYSSGSDTFFFLRLAERGFRMHWAADAIVFEHVPPARASLSWLRRRAAWQGAARLRTQRAFKQGLVHGIDRVRKNLLCLCRPSCSTSSGMAEQNLLSKGVN